MNCLNKLKTTVTLRFTRLINISALLWLLLLAPAVFAQSIADTIPVDHDKPVVDKILAVIGDEIVLKSDLEQQYLQYARSGNKVDSGTHCLIFEDILFKTLLLNQAEVDSITVSEEQVNSELDRRLNYFIDQIGSVEKLEEFYEKSIVEIKAEFHDLIKDQMLMQQMQSMIVGDVDVSPKEVEKFFKSIPEDSLPFIPSEVVVEQIVIYPEVSDEEKQLVKERLNGLRQRIMKGEDFGTLAYLYSEDPGSAKKNGELGFMSRKQLVPEFANVAFNIEKGQVSEVFETEYGFHIVQLIEKRGQQVNVRHILLKPKVHPGDLQRAKVKLDSIRNVLMTNDTITFERMAALYSDDESTRMNGGKLINRNTGNNTFELNEISQIDPSLFFVLDKMEPGDISYPVIYQKYDGSQAYRLVKLVSLTEPHRASLETDYQKIVAAARAEKEKEVIDKWIQEKIKTTYIRIAPEYRKCEYQHNWF